MFKIPEASKSESFVIQPKCLITSSFFLDDHLWSIICISKFYFQVSFFVWISNVCFFFGTGFIVLLLWNLINQSELVKEQDVFIAAITIVVCLRKTIFF